MTTNSRFAALLLASFAAIVFAQCNAPDGFWDEYNKEAGQAGNAEKAHHDHDLHHHEEGCASHAQKNKYDDEVVAQIEVSCLSSLSSIGLSHSCFQREAHGRQDGTPEPHQWIPDDIGVVS